MPNSYQANDSTKPISGNPLHRSEYGLPEQGFVYCCFNNNQKISPEVFDIWMRLLRADDASVLWLFAGNPAATENLRAHRLSAKRRHTARKSSCRPCRKSCSSRSTSSSERALGRASGTLGARTVAVGLRRDQRLTIAVRAPREVEGPIRRSARLGKVTVYVDGLRTATVPLRAGRAVPEASALDRARSFLEDEKIPVAIALCVILVGAVLARRFAR